MMPLTPTSPNFIPSSPLTPRSPYMSAAPFIEPLTQDMTDFPPEGMNQHVSSPPPLSITTNQWSQRFVRRSSTAMSVCSPSEGSIPDSPAIAIPALYSMRTPDRPSFPSPPSALREDGRTSRMAMRSPQFDRLMTLPLRVNTSMFPNFAPESIERTSQRRPQQLSLSFSEAETLVDWSRPGTPRSPLAKPLPRSPTGNPSRSPIRKHSRSRHTTRRLPTPPTYHVTVTRPSSPTQQRRQQYLYSVQHLRAPLVPLISVANGLPHPDFPTTLLQYHLLTHDQLDSLAKWYHQVTPAVEETFMYPSWVPAWTALSGASARDGVDLETKRRRWGRFIGLRGCESPTFTGPEGEAPDELVHRMEREWRRALERAEEEERAWEKSWQGRW